MVSEDKEYQEYVQEFMDDEPTIYKGDTPSKQEEKDESFTKNSETEYERGKHPNSLKAIQKHQYPKGVSGNVLGRPKTFEKLGKALKSKADEIVTNWRKEPIGNRRELVLERILRDAQDGDMKKIQLLAWLGCLDDE